MMHLNWVCAVCNVPKMGSGLKMMKFFIVISVCILRGGGGGGVGWGGGMEDKGANYL